MDPSILFWEPWEKLSPGQAIAFVKEVQLELSSGHPLGGLVLIAIAHSGGADDVLFQLEDGRAVEVHLTWSGRAEELPYPRHRIFVSLKEWLDLAMPQSTL